MWQIITGAFLVLYAAWEIRREETSTLFLLDFGDWGDFNRSDHPFLFWLFIVVQILVGLGMIAWGVMISR